MSIKTQIKIKCSLQSEKPSHDNCKSELGNMWLHQTLIYTEADSRAVETRQKQMQTIRRPKERHSEKTDSLLFPVQFDEIENISRRKNPLDNQTLWILFPPSHTLPTNKNTVVRHRTC